MSTPEGATVLPVSPQPVQVKEQSSAEREPFEPEMILIPAGKFLMGSDHQQDQDASDNERPQHCLYMPDYYLAKTPVTNAQYAMYVQETDYKQPPHWRYGKPRGGKEDHPVVYVSWFDAVGYCRWLSEATKKAYLLPSEAEWEKGARGMDGRIYPWDREWDAKLCNAQGLFRANFRAIWTVPTTFAEAYLDGASPYGLLNMAGNVWEWTCSLGGKVRQGQTTDIRTRRRTGVRT